MPLAEGEQIVQLGHGAHRRAQHLELADEQAAQVGARLVAAGGAAGDQAPAAHQRLQGGGPRGFAHVLEHHVHATPAGGGQRGLGDVFAAGVDRVVGAQRAGALQLAGMARGDDGARAQCLGQLQAGQRHAAADAEDQHRLPRLDLRLRDQHAPGREVVDAQRCPFGKRPAVRQRQHVARRHADVLRKAAVALLAQDLHARAQHVVAAQAELAASAGHAGVQQRALAHFKLRLIGIHFVDHARAIDAHDLGQAVRDARARVAHVQVHAVERGGVQAQAHLAGPARGQGALAHAHDRVAAVALEIGCLHAKWGFSAHASSANSYKKQSIDQASMRLPVASSKPWMRSSSGSTRSVWPGAGGASVSFMRRMVQGPCGPFRWP